MAWGSGGGGALGGAIWIIDCVAREAMLFAAIGLLVGGLDDLLVDLLFLAHRARRRRAPALTLETLPPVDAPGRLAVFVPAWDEAGVIGAMLATALARFRHDDFRILVGLYPNDRATIDAAAAVAAGDPRVQLVIGRRDGPTTKADNLNTLWRVHEREAARTGVATRAIVIHDAEDVVHPDELAVFDALIGRHAVVQLPVLPLVDAGARLVSGHYADEFAEAHGKLLVVRTALGAGMPLAGTGCALSPAILRRVAAIRGGDPFDAASLTEDYELGLRIAGLGGRGVFARVRDADGRLVAVRAYFPNDLAAAVRQKARWMTGIALAGWDRIGWDRTGAIGDHWMRMRDRRAPLAMIVLAAAYLAILAWGLAAALHWWTGRAIPVPGEAMRLLILVNTLLLWWRLSVRMGFTGRLYGRTEACWSLPRFVVGNFVSLLAAPRAVGRYLAMLRGAEPVWDKTRHDFPTLASLAE